MGFKEHAIPIFHDLNVVNGAIRSIYGYRAPVPIIVPLNKRRADGSTHSGKLSDRAYFVCEVTLMMGPLL